MGTVRNHSSDKALEWFGSMTGIAGAVLLAMNFDGSKYGFIFFLLSSFALIVFSYRRELTGLLTQQMVFFGINVLGIYRWML